MSIRRFWHRCVVCRLLHHDCFSSAQHLYLIIVSKTSAALRVSIVSVLYCLNYISKFRILHNGSQRKFKSSNQSEPLYLYQKHLDLVTLPLAWHANIIIRLALLLTSSYKLCAKNSVCRINKSEVPLCLEWFNCQQDQEKEIAVEKPADATKASASTQRNGWAYISWDPYIRKLWRAPLLKPMDGTWIDRCFKRPRRTIASTIINFQVLAVPWIINSREFLRCWHYLMKPTM